MGWLEVRGRWEAWSATLLVRTFSACDDIVMAGKGRGRGKYTFNLEVIGIGKGEALPSSSLAPPPLFPPLPVKTAPFCPSKSDHYNYLHDVKQELNSAFKSSKYFLVPPKVNLGIQRYSDKFAGSSDSPPKQTAESLGMLACNDRL